MPSVALAYKTGRGTTINSVLRQCSGTNTPTAGDLVGRNASGDMAYVADAPTSSTDIYGICVSDTQDGKLNAPGYTAAANGGFASAGFGGVGSRAATATPTRQKFIAPLGPDDLVMMTPTADTGVIGTSYGINRDGAGSYSLDISDTTNAIARIEGYYSPDVQSGAAIRRVWVKLTTARGTV